MNPSTRYCLATDQRPGSATGLAAAVDSASASLTGTASETAPAFATIATAGWPGRFTVTATIPITAGKRNDTDRVPAGSFPVSNSISISGNRIIGTDSL